MLEGIILGILLMVVGGLLVYAWVWWSMFSGWRR
jgi:hypothetical protein